MLYIVHIIHVMHVIYMMHILHILRVMHVYYFTLFSKYSQKDPVVFPYLLGNIMKTEKNHSLKQAPNDIVNYVKWADSINSHGCEATETGHKDWVKKQDRETN
jgi:hypothetical protein